MDPFIGQIQPVGFNFAPRGWALCAGQLMSINANSALFSLLGTAFGGDGRSTFALPDLRGRSIVGVGHGAALSNINWGQKAGAETISQVPSHSHSFAVPAHNGAGDETNPGGGLLASATSDLYSNSAANTVMAAGTTAPSGASSVNVRNPFLGIYMIIALQGVYPSRS